MLDLDSAEGKTACQKYLDSLASLLRDLGGSIDKRLHRMGFTATYKKMVSQRHYLADVLDSAQEAMPFMWVNGEKYVFSEHVISKGIELYQLFQEVTQFLPEVSELTELARLKSVIEKFDTQWSRYEEAYIGELMVIERDARRYLFELAESVQKMDRGAMFKAIGELNSVANT